MKKLESIKSFREKGNVLRPQRIIAGGMFSVTFRGEKFKDCDDIKPY